MNRVLHRPYPRAHEQGFTVLELLAVIVVTSGLIALSLWVAHPQDFTAADHNAARWTDVARYMQVLGRYKAENGTLPSGLPAQAQQIGDAKDMVDLCKALVPKYLSDMPLDPVDGGQYAAVDCRGTASEPGKYVTGYTIMQAPDGTVTVAAPSAEAGKRISISRAF